MKQIKTKKGGVRGVLSLLLLMLFLPVFSIVFADSGNIYVKKSGSSYVLKTLLGGLFNPTDINLEHLEFFLNSAPLSPKDPATSLSVPFEEEGEDVKFNLLNLPAGNVVVRVWEGAKNSSNYVVVSSGFKFSDGALVNAMPLGSPIPNKYYITGQTKWKAEKPPAPTSIRAELTGYTLEFKPRVTFTVQTIDLAHHELSTVQGGKYHFAVQKVESNGQPTGSPIYLPSASSSITDTENLSLNTNYKVIACATNWWVDSLPLANWSAPPVDLLIGGIDGAGPITIVDTLGPGIVQFGLPVDPTKEDFSVSGTRPANLDAFIRALDSTGKITTFGWWDGNKPVGYIITWAGGTPTYTPINGALPPSTVTAQPASNKDAVYRMNRVYQMNLTGSLAINMQGMR